MSKNQSVSKSNSNHSTPKSNGSNRSSSGGSSNQKVTMSTPKGNPPKHK